MDRTGYRKLSETEFASEASLSFRGAGLGSICVDDNFNGGTPGRKKSPTFAVDNDDVNNMDGTYGTASETSKSSKFTEASLAARLTARFSRFSTASAESVYHTASMLEDAEEQKDEKGYRKFKRRLDLIKAMEMEENDGEDGEEKQELPFDIEEMCPHAIKGKYKNRHVTGRLLHYAVFADYHSENKMCRDEAESVRSILQAQASPNSTFESTLGKSITEMQAVHMAAGLGYLPGLRMLIYAQADPNAWAAISDGSKKSNHYQPIHEACFHAQVNVVKELIEMQAEVSQPNKSGLLPLHLAAWAGSGECVEHLVSCQQFDGEMLLKRGRMWIENQQRLHTPLEIAVAQQKYPADQLLQLAGFKLGEGGFFSAIRQMVQRSHHRSAVKVLDSLQNMEDSTERAKIYQWIRLEAMRKNGRYDGTETTSVVACVAELIKAAPNVASAVLQLLQDTPYCNHIVGLKHPLPTRAVLRGADIFDYLLNLQGSMNTVYKSDHTDPAGSAYQTITKDAPDQFRSGLYPTLGAPAWKFDSERNEIPKWHDHLARRKDDEGAEQDTEVELTVLYLPNFLDTRILNGLLKSNNLEIFAVKSVQGLCIEFWKCINGAFFWDVLYELGVLSLLLDRALRIQEHDVRMPAPAGYSRRYQSICYSVFCAAALREFIMWMVWKVQEFRQFRVRKKRSVFKRSHCRSFCLDIMDGIWKLIPVIMLSLYVFFAAIDPMTKVSASPEDKKVDDVDDELDFSWTGSPSQFLLCINVLVRWLKLIFSLLCNLRGIGVTILTCMYSLKPMWDMYVIGFLLYCAFTCSLLSIRGSKSPFMVVYTFFSAIIRNDTNTYPFLNSLDGNLFCGLLSQSTMILAAFVYTICYMNLIIGVYCSLYASVQAKATLIWLRVQAMTSFQYTLVFEGYDVSPRYAMLLGSFLVILWAGGVSYCSKEAGLWLSPLLTIAQVIIQAASVKTRNVNIDIKLNGLEDSSEEEKHHTAEDSYAALPRDNVVAALDEEVLSQHRCLWMCHGTDFDERFFTHNMEEMRMIVSNSNAMLQDMRKEMDDLKKSMAAMRKGDQSFHRSSSFGLTPGGGKIRRQDS